ncbi:Fur family transcriptional regulator, ferric uptake regulator [Desulfotomaculum arcticum]|uniref:Fur family transcriptional regulator, ferric uptake regulator n=1 Tax=Desulfotruncus arcticus DSM 17038 TaxID=1121424 RepID=A0A1I2TV73_9FIRM|nr:Fur family transcriptional regulator [Desulfotruncus arcticus]SFG68778.1 Fur family transcriptional regulator, ferric uptake regulator [Desulfotomaculum arcticum] [Desulfotruncus arcticus DSM 17038]
MNASHEIFQILKDSGYKLTRQRRVIIDALAKHNRPVTAQEIYLQVRKNLPSISQDTLYRNLEVLAFVRVVNRIRVRGGDRFELAEQHHHHFICLKCGEVKCLKGCPIGPQQLSEANKNNLEVLYHNFELSGYCEKCRHRKEG